MLFEIVGDITDVEVIATGRGIRRLKHLRKRHGGKRWRKFKGNGTVRLLTGSTRQAEIHWLEWTDGHDETARRNIRGHGDHHHG